MSSSLIFTLSPLALLTTLWVISSFLARNVPKLLPVRAAMADHLSTLARPLRWAFDYSLRCSVLGHSHSHGEPGALGIIDELDVARYAGERPAECAVCLCEVGMGEEVRELKCCDHVFHRACLDRWLSYRNVTCPMCRGLVAWGAEIGAAVISLAFYDLGPRDDRESWWLR